MCLKNKDLRRGGNDRPAKRVWMVTVSNVKAIVGVAGIALAFANLAIGSGARAETIGSALVRSYQNNPQLNAQRAQVRSTDEGVPQALSGYRPKISVTASAAAQYLNSLTTLPAIRLQNVYGSNAGVTNKASAGLAGFDGTRSFGGTLTQTFFNGFVTANKTRQAESQVSNAREGLRVLEQTVLLAAATIYMDYLRDSAIVEVNRSNVRVLEQTLKQTQDRFNVGEVTRTDVAQSQAQLAAGQTQLQTAISNLTTTAANYRRIVGVEPVALAPGSPVDRVLPRALPAAVEIGLMENPNVTAAMYGIDVAFLAVKVNEGALFPTLTGLVSINQTYETTLTSNRSLVASAGLQLNVPVYQGGGEYALDPPIQGDACAAAADPRSAARSGTCDRRPKLGPARSRQGTSVIGAGAGDCIRDRAQRRARGGAGWPAHHARRVECSASSRERTRRARHSAARSCRCVVLGAGGDRPPVAASARTRNYDLRSERSLSSGSRCLGRSAHTRWTLSAQLTHFVAGNMRVHSRLLCKQTLA